MEYIIPITVAVLLVIGLAFVLGSRKQKPDKPTGNQRHGLTRENPHSEGAPAPMARETGQPPKPTTPGQQT